MKFFGEKSVSSFMYKLNKVGYYLSFLVLVGGILFVLIGIIDNKFAHEITFVTSGMFSIDLPKPIPEKFYGLDTFLFGIVLFYSSKWSIKLFDNFRKNVIFNVENTKALKILAMIEIFSGLYYDLTDYMDYRIAAEYINIKGVDINYFFFENSLNSVFLAIIFFMIAIALEQAIEYKEENELTV